MEKHLENQTVDFKAVILPTKSMQRVVTSVATKVTHLLISSSDIDNSTSDGSSSGNEVLFSGLVAAADATLLALKNLVKVTGQAVASEYPNDESIVEETDVAAQNLLVAGENLLLCCQILASTGGCSDDSTSNHLDLPTCISKCFQSLAILLLCVDNAEVRHLVNLSNAALDRLYRLSTSNTLEKLVEYFNAFAVAAHNFHTRSIRRYEDLLSSANRTKMLKGLTTLKHSMPMLTTALSLAIKYPKNDEAVSSKHFALQQVEKTIKDVVAIIKAKTDEFDFGGNAQIGLLASHIQFIENAMHPDSRYKLVTLELETMVQALVQHLMTLSVFVSKHASKFNRRSNYLVKECRKLIELVVTVTKMAPTSTSMNSSNPVLAHAEDTSEYGSVCRVVRGKLKSLMKCIQGIVVSLISHFFTITVEPLIELSRAYDSFRRSSNPQSLLKLKSSIGSFESHYKDIVQVATFVHMCCSDSVVFKDLQACISSFNHSSSQIVNCALSWTSQLEGDFHLSSNEGESFSSLSDDWQESIKALLHYCVLSMDLSQLTSGIESDIVSEFDRCHEEIVNLDDVSLSKHVIDAVGKAKLLSMVANGVVSGSVDPVYRNGVLAHVKQLNEAIAQAIASGNLLIEDTGRLSSQEAFLAAASSLKTKATGVCVALLSKTNHPQLTSEERKGLRDFSDPQKISVMIKEMHALNQKLLKMGIEPKVSPLQFGSEHSREPSCSEQIDELLGTSGPPVDISFNETEEENKNVVSFQKGNHPLITEFLTACNLSKNDSASLVPCVKAIRKMTDYMNSILDDCETRFSSSKLSVTNAKTYPVFLTPVDDEAESCGLSEAVSTWRTNLNESCSLIEGCVEHEKVDEFEMLKSLCDTWSKSSRILTGFCMKVLQMFTICVRKYLALSDSEGENTPCGESDLASSVGEDSSIGAPFSLEKTHGSLLMLGRMNETLSILLSDVILLYQREIDNNYSKEKSTPVISRLETVLDRSRKVSSDLTLARKELKKKTQKIDDGELLTSQEISWLHIYSVMCASKLQVLSSNVEAMSQMVLGVRKLHFPTEYFLNGDAKSFQLLREYKEKILSLSKSVVDKTNRTLAKHNLEIDDISKVHKIRNRIEISCESIVKILEFVLAQKFSATLLNHHGYLLCHALFLHQRFSLEVARVLLIIKALTLISSSHPDQENQATVQSNLVIVKGRKVKGEESEQHPGINPSNQAQSFSERLAALTQQRKEREKDLFYLLSDIDVDNFIPDKKEAHFEEAKLNTSEK